MKYFNIYHYIFITQHTTNNDKLILYKRRIKTSSINVLNGIVDNENLLFIACKHHSESVKYLLECDGFTDENINARTTCDVTTLM